MNYRKSSIIAITAISFLIIISLFLGLFLSTDCFSSEKEEAKLYDLMANKEYAQAITILKSLISKTKDLQTKSKYQYFMATCRRMNGQWESAISDYKLVADEKESRFSEIARLRIAKHYQEICNYPSAINEYEKLLDDHPKSPSAIEAQYQVAECYYKLNNHEKAIENYGKFISLYPEGSRSRLCAYKIGDMYQESEKFQEAYDQYQKVLRQYTNNYAARQCLEKIKPLLTSCTQINVSRDDSYYMGLVLFYAKQYKDAREEFEKAIKDTDDLSERASYFMAQSLHKEGSYDLAQKEYEAFIKTYTNSQYVIESEYNIAECVWKSGKTDEAIKLLTKFASDYPKSSLADDAELKIADLYKERNQFTKASEIYGDIAEKYPSSDSADDALWNMGWSYMELKNYDKSAQSFQRLISQYPESQLSSSARFWAGVSYEKIESFKEAVVAYKQAMDKRDWYYSDRAKRHIDSLVEANKIDKETASYQYKKAEFEEFLPVITTIKQLTPLWVNEALNIGIIDDVVDVFKALEESEIALEAAYYNLSVCYERMGEFRTSWGYIWRLTKLSSAKSENGMLPRHFYIRLFPTVYTKLVHGNSQANNVDPHLVSAVIREESRYDYKAVSSSGARGLMQIMPTTGKDIAERIDIKKFDTDMLFEPENNIKMGSWYLSQLINSFTARTREYFVSKGNPQPESVYTDIATILALGGYNAGPTRMRRWMDEYDIEDIEIFVENIPMQEPRHYIKKVLDSYEMYKALYNG